MGTYTRSELEFILNQLKLAGAYDDAPAPAHSDPAAGTPPNDVLLGTSAGDLVFGFAGTDYIVTGAGPDVVGAGADNGFAVNEADRDVLFGDDDDDDIFDDSDGDDLIVGSLDDANDTHYSDDITIDAGDDTVAMSNSVNVVHGGQGEAVFVFSSTTAAHDTIRDLQAGDKIDLGGTAGNDTITLEDGQGTSAPAQIVATHETQEDDQYTVISGDTAGETAPEFGVSIAGDHVLPSADFDL